MKPSEALKLPKPYESFLAKNIFFIINDFKLLKEENLPTYLDKMFSDIIVYLDRLTGFNALYSDETKLLDDIKLKINSLLPEEKLTGNLLQSRKLFFSIIEIYKWKYIEARRNLIGDKEYKEFIEAFNTIFFRELFDINKVTALYEGVLKFNHSEKMLGYVKSSIISYIGLRENNYLLAIRSACVAVYLNHQGISAKNIIEIISRKIGHNLSDSQSSESDLTNAALVSNELHAWGKSFSSISLFKLHAEIIASYLKKYSDIITANASQNKDTVADEHDPEIIDLKKVLAIEDQEALDKALQKIIQPNIGDLDNSLKKKFDRAWFDKIDINKNSTVISSSANFSNFLDNIFKGEYERAGKIAELLVKILPFAQNLYWVIKNLDNKNENYLPKNLDDLLEQMISFATSCPLKWKFSGEDKLLGKLKSFIVDKYKMESKNGDGLSGNQYFSDELKNFYEQFLAIIEIWQGESTAAYDRFFPNFSKDYQGVLFGLYTASIENFNDKNPDFKLYQISC